MPHLVKMQEKYGDKGLVVLGVTAADEGAAKDFAVKRSVSYPILASAAGDMKIWGVRAVPSTFLLDANGSIVMEDDLDAMSEHLEKQLGG